MKNENVQLPPALADHNYSRYSRPQLKKELPKVAKKPRGRQRYFRCDHCHFKSKFRAALKNHQRLMDHVAARLKALDSGLEQKKWRCKICPYSTNNKQSMDRHQKWAHRNSFCGYCSFYDVDSKSEEASRSQCSSIVCCYFHFKSMKSYKRHRAINHKLTPVEAVKKTCWEMRSELSPSEADPKGLMRKISVTKVLRKKYVRKVDTKFLTGTKSHPKTSGLETHRRQMCVKCDFSSDFARGLRYHEKWAHHRFFCCFCSYGSYRKASLATHLAVRHSTSLNSNFLCCNRLFKAQRSLAMHRKIKHRPFVTNKNQEDFVCPEIKVEVKTEVIENDEDFSFVKQIKPEDQEHRADFNGNMGILDDKEQKRVFLYAFIDDDEKAFLHRIVSRLGGISRPHEMMYVSDATHIVIPNQESEKLCPKVIGALASGKIVVKASYLYFCDKENAFADEKGFIPKSAQDALAHIKQHGKLFVNDTVIVYLTNSRRQAELKNILRDGGAQVLNWSYKDLSQKSPEETAKVTTVFTDLSACSNRHFNEFQARRAAEGKPVKVLSYVCIFKLVLHSSLGDQRKVFEDLFSVTNEALMSKLHPKVSEPEIEIVPTQTRAGMGTRQEKKIEEVTLNTSSEDTDDDIEVLDEKISNVRPPKVFAYTQYRPSFRRRKTDNANDTVIDLVSSDEEAVEPKKEINEDINSGATLEIIQASNSKEKICPETIISPELEKVEEPPVKKRILNLGLTASGTRPAFLDFGTITQPEPSQDSSESSSEENEPMLGSPVAADAEDSQDTANANPSQIAEDSSSNQDESTAMSTDEDISQDHTVMQITENDDCVTSHGDDNISQTEGTLQPDGVNLFQENGGLSSECITSFKPIEVEDSVLEKAIQRFLYNQEVENMGLETGVVKTPCYDRHHESRLKKEFLNNRNQPLSAPIEDNDRFFDDFLKSSRDKAPLLKSLNVLFLAIRPVLSSRSYFAPDVLSNVMSEIASRKGPPSLRLFIIHEYLGLLHEQLRYHPTTRMDMRNYYVTFFGGNIPDFVHNTVTSALKRDANFQLYVGMLDFAVTVLKQDLEYWWRHHKGRKATEEPLVKIYATKLPPCGTSNLLNFLEEIYAYRVIEDIERCQKVPKLTGIMMKLMAVIGIYFGVREDRTARPLSRKKNLKQNLSADLGNMFVKMYGNKSIKEIVMRTSLIRPSWLSTLVTLKFLKAERFQDSRQVFSADPAIQAILKRLPSKTLGENINRSPRELLLHLLNEFLCTYPVHAIARAVLNDEEVKIKTLKAWQSKNAGKEVALGRNIRFDNYVAFKKADIMSDVRLCVNLISRLKIQNGPGKLSHWHFL